MSNKYSCRFRTAEYCADDFEPKHNAENRPVRWVQGDTVVTMGFDRMGRRVFYKEMEGDTQVTHTVFLYNGYTCIQQLFSNSPWNVYKEFIWDPTEPIATRPLCFRQYGETAVFYLYDGNKNVSDVVTVAPYNTVVAHYDYAPFGATTATGARASDNPHRFSSEVSDDTLGLIYYNYRHYNPIDGRWVSRDISEVLSYSLYCFVCNAPFLFDVCGLVEKYTLLDVYNRIQECSENCPELMNWQAGLDYLSTLIWNKTSNVLDDVIDDFEGIEKILDSKETVKDFWNTLNKDNQINISFNEIEEPLSKFIKNAKIGRIIQQLNRADELTSVEMVGVLQDILSVSNLGEVPILSNYFNKSLFLIGEALDKIEDIHNNQVFSLILSTDDCSQIMDFLSSTRKPGLTRTLFERMNKRRRK